VMALEGCGDLPYQLDFSPLEQVGFTPSTVVVQLPPGLKQYSTTIAECISKITGWKNIILHGDPSYGACDLSYPELSTVLGADLIVHVGHTPYPKSLSPTVEPGGRPRIVYVPAKSKTSISEDAAARAAEILSPNARRVGLTSTVQHAHLLPALASMLMNHGLETVLPRGRPPYFLPGQVLGCDYTTALAAGPVDAYIFLGGGFFHPLGLYLATRKQVVQVDPYSSTVRDVTPDAERVYKVRLYKVSQAFDARVWGIIVGLKTGQYRPMLIRRITRLVEEKGAKYSLIAFERVTLQELRDIATQYDAFVVTSCPRLPIDDLSHCEKPVLTPGEARMALSGRLEPYLFPW